MPKITNTIAANQKKKSLEKPLEEMIPEYPCLKEYLDKPGAVKLLPPEGVLLNEETRDQLDRIEEKLDRLLYSSPGWRDL